MRLDTGWNDVIKKEAGRSDGERLGKTLDISDNRAFVQGNFIIKGGGTMRFTEEKLDAYKMLGVGQPATTPPTKMSITKTKTAIVSSTREDLQAERGLATLNTEPQNPVVSEEFIEISRQNESHSHTSYS